MSHRNYDDPRPTSYASAPSTSPTYTGTVDVTVKGLFHRIVRLVLDEPTDAATIRRMVADGGGEPQGSWSYARQLPPDEWDVEAWLATPGQPLDQRPIDFVKEFGEEPQ